MTRNCRVHCICICVYVYVYEIYIQEGDTLLPPCVLRTALFWHCVLRTAIFWPRVLRTVLQQKQPFWPFPFT